MARDLSPLLVTLTPGEELSLEALDPRLAGVMDLADKRQFGGAADRAELLVEEGVLDIRPISVLLYDAFFQGGLGVMSRIFAVITNLVGSSVAAVGPSKRKETHFNLRLSWLFEELSTSLVYHEKKRSPEWLSWSDGVTIETVEKAVSDAGTLIGTLTAGSFAASAGNASKVHEWLVGYRSLLKKSADQDAAALAKAQPNAAPKHATMPPPASSGSHAAQESLDPVRRHVEMVVSHAFLELLSKLKAFETLVGKGELMKAALVSEEIEAVLERFDPRSFFPEFFGAYCSLRSKNIERLSQYGPDHDPTAWKAHSEYYKVDPKGFVGD